MGFLLPWNDITNGYGTINGPPGPASVIDESRVSATLARVAKDTDSLATLDGGWGTILYKEENCRICADPALIADYWLLSRDALFATYTDTYDGNNDMTNDDDDGDLLWWIKWQFSNGMTCYT